MQSTCTNVSTQAELFNTLCPTFNGVVGIATPSPPVEEDDWEVVSPEKSFENDMILVSKTLDKPQLVYQRSSSVPDLRYLKSLDAVADDSADEGDLKAHVTSVWGNPVSSLKKVSSSLQVVASLFTSNINVMEMQQHDVLSPLEKRLKIKPKFVVAPIHRCTKSTGDLQSLGLVNEEITGDHDALEYYAQKSAGQKGRQNGQKIRPDEAKRRDIILNKKDLQRQGQASK